MTDAPKATGGHVDPDGPGLPALIEHVTGCRPTSVTITEPENTMPDTPDTTACHRCLGCGQLADSDDQEPWAMWADLPPRSRLAVDAGLVKPVTCPDCGGTGKAQPAGHAPLSGIAVYVSIGNSDDKLAQAEWSDYLHRFRTCAAEHATRVYGDWISEPSSLYQNACIALTTENPAAFKAALTSLRAEYRQDAVAWAVAPRTEFI